MNEKTLNTYFNKIKNIYKTIKTIEDTFEKDKPIILCLGSKRFSSDLLYPLTGELLKHKYNVNTYVYGCLAYPITYLNYEYVLEFLNLFHSNRPILVVDACVGDKDEFGQIKIIKDGISPGKAVNRNINKVGDLSIVGITADFSFTFKQLMFKTKLEVIYKMADFIAFSISKALGTIKAKSQAV